MALHSEHEPCHDDAEPWDRETGRYRCGCSVEDQADCLVCETEWPCPEAVS